MNDTDDDTVIKNINLVALIKFIRKCVLNNKHIKSLDVNGI